MDARQLIRFAGDRFPNDNHNLHRYRNQCRRLHQHSHTSDHCECFANRHRHSHERDDLCGKLHHTFFHRCKHVQLEPGKSQWNTVDRYACHHYNLHGYRNCNKRVHSNGHKINYRYTHAHRYHNDNRRNHLFRKLDNDHRKRRNNLRVDAGQLGRNNSYGFANYYYNLYSNGNNNRLYSHSNKNNYC
jgi:hypothetical protein